MSNKWIVDAIYAMFFGLLSMFFGYIQFLIPGIEGARSDFREIPLLISVFYTKNPFFFLISSLLTSFSTPEEGSYISTVIMHFVGLFVIWFAYQKLIKAEISSLYKGILWVLFTFIYYSCLVVPIMIITYKFFGLEIGGSFSESYTSLMSSLQFEILTSTLVTSLYLVQMEVRDQLQKQNENLEKIVKDRTCKLDELNKELTANNGALLASNKHIKLMNENLDLLARERSEKIQAQLGQLLKYSHMNSHEVRAPLARILGLINLLKIDKDQNHVEDLYQRIMYASEELDTVVKKMNRILQDDPTLNKN